MPNTKINEFFPGERRFNLVFGLAVGARLLPRTVLAGFRASMDPEMPGYNPMYFQDRDGQRVAKFRTLIPDHPSSDALMGRTNDSASRNGQRMRDNGDDETPQVYYNVLWRGDMSLVGRRKVVAEDARVIKAAVGPKKFAAWEKLPGGLTGRGQLLRHGIIDAVSPEAYAKSVELDLEWAEVASPAVNLDLILRTPVVLESTKEPTSLEAYNLSLLAIAPEPAGLTQWLGRQLIPALR